MLFWLISLPLLGGFLSWFCSLWLQRVSAWASVEEKTDGFNEPLNTRSLHFYPAIIAIITMVIVLLLVSTYWYDALSAYNQGIAWRQEIDINWIAILDVRFHLILDGFSIVMITLTVIISLLAIIYALKEKRNNNGLFYLCLLFMTSGVTSLFMAVDLFLFFFLWEAVAIPVYFLIALWGRRDSSAQLRFNGTSKFLIFSQISGLFMLISIVSLALMNWTLTNKWSFDYNVLIRAPISSYVEFMLMLGFFAAFAIRVPLVPFHGWFIDAHIESSISGSIMISGLLMSTTTYGLLRFVIPLFPNASVAFTPYVLAFCLFTLFYAGLLIFKQNDIKKLIAYVHIALMAFITAMIYSGSLLTYQGIVIQIIAVNLSVVGLFIVSGLLTERYLTRNIRQFIGLRGHVRYLSTITLFFVLAILGIPGTANFVGNFMALFGSYDTFSLVTVLFLMGILLVSISLMMRMQPILGHSDPQQEPQIRCIFTPLALRDLALLFFLLFILFVIGLYPQFILDTTAPVISKIQLFMENAHNAVNRGGM